MPLTSSELHSFLISHAEPTDRTNVMQMRAESLLRALEGQVLKATIELQATNAELPRAPSTPREGLKQAIGTDGGDSVMAKWFSEQPCPGPFGTTAQKDAFSSHIHSEEAYVPQQQRTSHSESTSRPQTARAGRPTGNQSVPSSSAFCMMHCSATSPSTDVTKAQPSIAPFALHGMDVAATSSDSPKVEPKPSESATSAHRKRVVAPFATWSDLQIEQMDTPRNRPSSSRANGSSCFTPPAGTRGMSSCFLFPART